jgi:hypothetical protein
MIQQQRVTAIAKARHVDGFDRMPQDFNAEPALVRRLGTDDHFKRAIGTIGGAITHVCGALESCLHYGGPRKEWPQNAGLRVPG